MKKRLIITILIFVFGAIAIQVVDMILKERANPSPGELSEIDHVINLIDPDPTVVSISLERIESDWGDGYAAMLLELVPYIRNPEVVLIVQNLIERKTGQNFQSLDEWDHWLWQKEYKPHPDYAEFKTKLYKEMDPLFTEYFTDTEAATIRLDEIRWGGVVRDGIPPLKNPKMISASEATYLDDSNVVFGVEINGDARAYPKRILAWHEMFKDTIGGESICGVYCTLCGSMIIYHTEFEGKHYELGTSGFLYRSNKLMYDHKTKSMWSTMTGEPVVGPLVGQKIKLKRGHVVTTTWGEWRERHPETKVISLDTGHERDYSEGVAYADYFANDQLMFRVPFHDARLKNKDEVLALRFDDIPIQQLAIAVKFLDEHPIYHDQIGDRKFVVITKPGGANRVYEAGSHRFKSWDNEMTIVDEDNQNWTLSESELKSSTGETLKRLPAHRAFWFGWHAAYPETRLVD